MRERRLATFSSGTAISTVPRACKLAAVFTEWSRRCFTSSPAGYGSTVNSQATRDDDWYASARNETRIERLDRNWLSLLQELRVAQTGVQLLTGFLLTLPFQSRFEDLSTGQQSLYLATVMCSVTATALLIAPVAMHRLLFRRHQLDLLVDAAHRCALVGMLMLGLALVGVVALVFSTVVGTLAASLAAMCITILLLTSWLILPLTARRSQPDSTGPLTDLGEEKNARQ